MPLTLTYDFSENGGTTHHNYVRSMFERFAWKQIGGSTFTYMGRKVRGQMQEDWLNEVAPSIMHFRSYLLKHKLKLNKFTLNASSFTTLDHSSPGTRVGRKPLRGKSLKLTVPPANARHSSEKQIKAFVTSCTQNV
jgi:hypothetical protein